MRWSCTGRLPSALASNFHRPPVNVAVGEFWAMGRTKRNQHLRGNVAIAVNTVVLVLIGRVSKTAEAQALSLQPRLPEESRAAIGIECTRPDSPVIALVTADEPGVGA